MLNERYVMNDPTMETIRANASTATAVKEPPDRPLIDRDDWMKERPTFTISRNMLIADRKRQSSDSLKVDSDSDRAVRRGAKRGLPRWQRGPSYRAV